MVQRWEQHSFVSCGDCIEQMVTEPDGDYVLYSDYESLEAANCDLKKQLERAREALKKISSGMGRDILGATSLSREDMQSIAKQALEG